MVREGRAGSVSSDLRPGGLSFNQRLLFSPPLSSPACHCSEREASRGAQALGALHRGKGTSLHWKPLALLQCKDIFPEREMDIHGQPACTGKNTSSSTPSSPGACWRTALQCWNSCAVPAGVHQSKWHVPIETPLGAGSKVYGECHIHCNCTGV